MKKTILTIISATILSIGSLFAQQTPKLNKHQKAQKVRIADGVASGELSKKEAAKLRKQQRQNHKLERMAKADGVITPRERKIIKHNTRQANKNIARQKNDNNNF